MHVCHLHANPCMHVYHARMQRETTGESDLAKAVTLVLHDKRVEQIQGLEACPGLRTVDLSFNRITKIEGWGACMRACMSLLLRDAMHLPGSASAARQRVSGMNALRSWTALHPGDYPWCYLVHG